MVKKTSLSRSINPILTPRQPSTNPLTDAGGCRHAMTSIAATAGDSKFDASQRLLSAWAERTFVNDPKGPLTFSRK